MKTQALSLDSLFDALAEGWRVANETRGISIAYTALFVVGGVLIMGGLLARGWTPFVIAAAGAFMLVGPAVLAGYFGIAAALAAAGGVDHEELVSLVDRFGKVEYSSISKKDYNKMMATAVKKNLGL